MDIEEINKQTRFKELPIQPTVKQLLIFDRELKDDFASMCDCDLWDDVDKADTLFVKDLLGRYKDPRTEFALNHYVLFLNIDTPYFTGEDEQKAVFEDWLMKEYGEKPSEDSYPYDNIAHELLFSAYLLAVCDKDPEADWYNCS